MSTSTVPHILIVDDDVVTAAWLRALFENEKYNVQVVTTGAAMLEQFRAAAPDLVLLDRVLPDADGLALIQRVRQEPHGAHTWIVILSARANTEDIIAGMNAGADDYIPKRPGADVELLAKAKALLARPSRAYKPTPAPPAASELGYIVSFFSPKGGSGTTTIAVNTAYSLRDFAPHATTLLVDLVFPLGSVGRMIGFESDDTLAKLTRQVQGSTDRKLIARYISPSRHYGFRVLLSANDVPEAQALEVSRIEPLFHTLRTMFDYVLVDFGRALSRITLPILELSDLIFVIVTPDVNAVALTKASLDYLYSLKIARERIYVIQNRVVPRVWMSKEDAEKELGVPIEVTIPYDGEQLPLATNAHVPYLERHADTGVAVALREIGRVTVERLQRHHAVRTS